MNEEIVNYLNEIRRDFAGKPLDEGSVAPNPIQQFEIWFEEAVNAQLLDPYAMTMSTVDADGKPSLRVVYMRGVSDEGFVFYTNYKSSKGLDLERNNKIALNFFWGELERQVRVEGEVEKVKREDSDAYFAQRPRDSQIGAWASSQSEKILDRKQLEEQVAFYINKFKDQEVPRPEHWGGYVVKPMKIEFWQGRPSRLHDRIVYVKNGNKWGKSRLSP